VINDKYRQQTDSLESRGLNGKLGITNDNIIALTKKLLDKTRKEWDECLRRKREEYASCGVFEGVEVPPVIDESYIK
jgi:hypothetical protein